MKNSKISYTEVYIGMFLIFCNFSEFQKSAGNNQDTFENFHLNYFQIECSEIVAFSEFYRTLLMMVCIGGGN